MAAKYESQKSGLLDDSEWIKKAQSISDKNECPKLDGHLDQSREADEETGIVIKSRQLFQNKV